MHGSAAFVLRWELTHHLVDLTHQPNAVVNLSHLLAVGSNEIRPSPDLLLGFLLLQEILLHSHLIVWDQPSLPKETIQRIRPVKDPGRDNGVVVIFTQYFWSIVLPDPLSDTVIFSVDVTEVGILKDPVVTPRLGFTVLFKKADYLPFLYPVCQKLRRRIISSTDL